MLDAEKMEILVRIFMFQKDTEKMTNDNNKKTGKTVTNKLFTTADLMQFFFDYAAKDGNVISFGVPIPKIQFKVGEEGILNGVHFEIINGSEEIYTGLEMYQSLINSK